MYQTKEKYEGFPVVKQIDIDNDDPYSLHLIGGCDLECEYCKEEEQELRKKKYEGKNNQGRRLP